MRARFWIGLAAVGVGRAVPLASVQVGVDGVSLNNEDPGCVDEDDRCAEWAEAGECALNPSFMMASCVQSCNVCPAEVCCRQGAS